MLSKKERLNRATFNRFFASGKRIQGTYIQLIYTKYPSLHASVVVSKKVAKKAVERNKIRRRIYAIVRTILQKERKKGVYICIVKPSAYTTSFQELKDDIKALTSRI